jgi:hypothetical protein
MRATEFLRQILDLLDGMEQDPEDGKNMVQDMINNKQDRYSTQPNEIVSDIESITTLAGGGPNKPKHPDDIRIKDPRGFRP